MRPLHSKTTILSLTTIFLIALLSPAVANPTPKPSLQPSQLLPSPTQLPKLHTNSAVSSPSQLLPSPTQLPKLQTNSTNSSPSPSPSAISPTPTATKSPAAYRNGRLFYISSHGYMGKILSHDRQLVQSISTLQKYVEYVENDTLTFLRSKKDPTAGQPLRPCNSEGTKFIGPVGVWFEDRLLPSPDVSCITEFSGVRTQEEGPSLPSSSPLTMDELHAAVQGRAWGMWRNREIVAAVLLGNWSTPSVTFNYNYTIANKRCIVNHVSGHRLGAKWYITSSFTNAPPTYHAELFGRHWLSEYVRAAPDGERMEESMRFSARVRPPENATSQAHVFRPATTTLTSSGGGTGPWSFVPMHPEDNPAVRAALDMSDLSIQQADDALAVSSIAILIMPLALNLVPIALLASVNTKIMLVYTMMSDVVTVIPLGIKGLELIGIARQKHRSVTIRFTGAVNGSLSETSAMVMYTADCRAERRVLGVGVAFVVLACVFLVVGVVLEFVAKYHLARRELLDKLLEVENEPLLEFGGVVEGVGMSSAIGATNNGVSNYGVGYTADLRGERARGRSEGSGGSS